MRFRKLFPYLALATLLSAVAWAISFGTLPPADLTFVNGTEIKTVDPAAVTGAPEGRIIYALFDGLYGVDPQTGEPIEGIATTLDVSKDNKHFVFPLRKDATWVDRQNRVVGPVTAHDFVWSFRRFLHPGTASEYAYQLWYVENAERYTKGQVKIGDRVEVELADRKNPSQLFPSGTIVRGQLKAVSGPNEPAVDADGYVVKSPENVYVVLDDKGGERRFTQQLSGTALAAGSAAQRDPQKPPLASDIPPAAEQPNAELCLNVLLDFDSQVPIRALDDYTLEIKLKNATPFFIKLMAFYPLYPVNRACVETHGYPAWTKPENIVTNGPFRLEFRRIRDRIRMVKNTQYWNQAAIRLNTIDALAVESSTTALNMYLNGQVDWITTAPTTVIPELEKRPDYSSRPSLAVYYYRLNVNKPPLDDPRVRRALNMAMDKQEIVQYVTRAGQVPARSFVPPGIKDYDHPPQCGPYDVAAARQLLAEAGYPGGTGFPAVEILYNTNDAHKQIAEKIQDQWKSNLGIDVRLANQEWAVMLSSVRKSEYQIARSAWIGDYIDPNTFLDMFVTDGTNNQTNWGNKQYDALIAAAAEERDTAKRLDLFRQAEKILMDEQPLIPIYFYVSVNMVKPHVQGFHATIQDVHPLDAMYIDQDVKKRLQAEGAR